MKRQLIIFLFLISVFSCTKNDHLTCEDVQHTLQDNYSFKVGTAVESYVLEQDATYKGIVDEEFNSITPENQFKPYRLNPEPNVYHWFEADQLVAYAEANTKRVHGHTLIWHQGLPYWMTTYEGTSDQWDSIMKNYIHTVVSHFKGKVESWDVVNEAFNEDGTLRSSIWHTHLGPGYIAKAFQYAHEADPDAKLFYNDFGLALNPLKRTAILNLMKSLTLNGIPIDGIGMQSHFNILAPENNEIRDAITAIYNAGFLVHISELDMSVNPKGEAITSPSELQLKRQADKVASIFKMYSTIPKEYQYGITFWGVDDSHSWIPSYFNRVDFPLLFTADYQRKPAYCKLISK